MITRTLLALVAFLAVTGTASAQSLLHIKETPANLQLGRKTTTKIGVYGSTPVTRPSGVGQSALTDSTGGTAGTTLAAGVGIYTLTIPIQLASMTTSAADLVTEIVPGHAGKILSVDFVTTTLGTGSGASQALNLEIGTTNVTGGVVTATLTSTNTLGKVTSGTAITAANTFTATDSISVEVAASGTVFTGGAGFLRVRIQNLDTANAIASLARLANSLRSALAPTTGLGIIAGQ